jgi:SET domain-containing protein
MLNRHPDSALSNPDYIVVLESPIQGKGIFTTKPCEAGEVLMIIAGETINADECLRREEEEDNVYIFYNDDDTYIDTAMTAKIRYINHSCEPSAEVKDRDRESLYLVAARSIQAGEEITIDYDYEEIYDVCFAHNPACKKEQCLARRRMLRLQSLSE